jgi:glycosyltransferase involved in cell wall biosynthesis
MQMSVSQNKQNFYHHFIYSPVDAFLVITRQLQAQFQHRIHPEFVERVHLLYYGTEFHEDLKEDQIDALKKRNGIRPGAFTVGLFGKKNEGKGQHLLIEALREMRDDGMDVMGLLVGPATDSTYNRIILKLIADRKLEKDIVVLDFVENPQQLMQICQCVVLASYKETFGLVLIEAMSAGTAIVGSNQGGVPEIIDDGETGLLFESRNAASLGHEIRKLYENRSLLDRLARQGRRKAENSFSYKHHYENLLGYLKGEIHERTEFEATPQSPQ